MLACRRPNRAAANPLSKKRLPFFRSYGPASPPVGKNQCFIPTDGFLPKPITARVRQVSELWSVRQTFLPMVSRDHDLSYQKLKPYRSSHTGRTDAADLGRFPFAGAFPRTFIFFPQSPSTAGCLCLGTAFSNDLAGKGAGSINVRARCAPRPRVAASSSSIQSCRLYYWANLRENSE